MHNRPKSFSAGDLTRRATLLEPVQRRDKDGQIIQGYADRGTVWANLLPLRGGESVMQARMESRNPAIVTVRASPLTRSVTSEWRVTIDGREYDVKEDPRETQDRAFLEFLVEARDR
ncbi:phage head closure protein [Falsirhodobacter sp. 20TX0035]|uniref:phage head closure protein n=1 Tax=Falsirhodobacter sp. 20TX0035 TaxID=3022019 RepID=UPI00232CCCAC|nr:phage head closure protein [Falsirhodobacter sp. 20TX0035]MDB6455013.1 phage head closure protein [Falsirhodobacter sp. 20TX0035]